jgi:hypothetical protein
MLKKALNVAWQIKAEDDSVIFAIEFEDPDPYQNLAAPEHE